MPSASSHFDLDSGHSTSSAPPTTGAADQRIHRTVRWLQVVAWTVAASVGLLLPVLYWMQQTRMLDTALQIETEQLAASLSKQAARVPDRWMYRLNALKAELAVVTERGVSNAIRLNNARGQELVAVGTWRLNLQHSTRSEVMDSGVHVATVELQTDLRPAAVEALKAAIVGAVLAWLVWWSMARLALGGLRAAFEELQSARDVAQSANRAKSAFLAAMSHEIRTPMNGVLGMAELLAHSPLDAEQAQTVTTVRESAQSLLRIIDDILDFSKIEAGRLELEAEPLLVTPLVEGTCDALAAVAAAREVQLWACVEPGVPERVLSDAVRIRQV